MDYTFTYELQTSKTRISPIRVDISATLVEVRSSLTETVSETDAKGETTLVPKKELVPIFTAVGELAEYMESNRKAIFAQKRIELAEKIQTWESFCYPLVLVYGLDR